MEDAAEEMGETPKEKEHTEPLELVPWDLGCSLGFGFVGQFVGQFLCLCGTRVGRR